MKKVWQTRFGSDGNCWPAVLASMLEIPIEEVDHCACSLNKEDRAWEKSTDEFLASRGLFYVEVQRDEHDNWPLSHIPERSLIILGCNTDRNLPHVIIGRAFRVPIEEVPESKRAFGHPEATHGLDFELVHDPLPNGSTGIKVDSILLLCRLDK